MEWRKDGCLWVTSRGAGERCQFEVQAPALPKDNPSRILTSCTHGIFSLKPQLLLLTAKLSSQASDTGSSLYST